MAINFGIDTKELVSFTKRLEGDGEKASKALVTASINDIGDQVVALVATNLSRQTGLTLEQVRGQIRVKRAKRGDLAYEVTVKKGLMNKDEARALEGKRESEDFGKREPRDMVIVVTKDDDLVCPDCEELQAAGPMPFDIAKEHIPKHPHCRCVILPYTPKGKRLPVTMTTVSGTDPSKRMGGKRPIDVDMTLRQIANDVVKNNVNKIRFALKTR